MPHAAPRLFFLYSVSNRFSPQLSMSTGNCVPPSRCQHSFFSKPKLHATERRASCCVVRDLHLFKARSMRLCGNTLRRIPLRHRSNQLLILREPFAKWILPPVESIPDSEQLEKEI